MFSSSKCSRWLTNGEECAGGSQEASASAAETEGAVVGGEAGIDEPEQRLDKAIASLQADLESTKAKLAETHDRMLRTAAELENSRRRWERERAEVRQYSITEFARDLLPVIDAFDKAMSAVDSCQANPDTEEGKRLLAIVEGVQLVSRVFHDSVKKHGIERLPGKGEPFNPSFHNAIAKVVDPSVAQDCVLDEFVSGYRIGDRVLRTAMVRVASKE